MVRDAFENVAAERAAMIERARVWSTEVHRRVRLRRVGDWHPRRCGQRCVRAKGGHLHVRVHMQLALPCEAKGGHLHVLQHVQPASAGERRQAFGGRRRAFRGRQRACGSNQPRPAPRLRVLRGRGGQ